MCPLDRVLTYKNLIYLLNLQFIALIIGLGFFRIKPIFSGTVEKTG